MESLKRPLLAVFASGSGSTFQATAEAVYDGVVDFDIGLVITDHEDAGVLQRVADINNAYGWNIKTVVINKKRYPGGPQPRGQTLDEAKATCQALKDHKIDHLTLMGCLRVIGKQVIKEYGWRPEYAKQDPKHKGIYLTRLTNTHPGILPATTDTFGIHTQELVIKLGLKETAHTFHALAAGVDEGPVIAQNRVRVYPTDTPQKLFARVQRIEKAHLPLDIDAFLKDQAAIQL
jgi:phosphoribosylglycinamide formyltransferase-1